MSQPEYSRDEIMTVTAARQLRNGAVCFVGIGLPSAACNLARLTHAPDLVLIYESGTVGVQPAVLPLSIGDGELAETATCIVPLPEIFAHYLQRGRIDVGFLGAAQIDRFANLNSTVIGDYAHPRVRLPGGGGAPEIANYAHEVLVVMKQTPRSFVERLDFRTSCGYLEGAGARRRTERRDYRLRRAAPEPRERGARAVRALPRSQPRGRTCGHRLAAEGEACTRDRAAPATARARGAARSALTH